MFVNKSLKFVHFPVIIHLGWNLFVHTGPVELAAVGVSIALFNQVSRVAIFPLVSVTTSFVAEEDTLGGASSQAEENGSLEEGAPMDAETKEFIPQKGRYPFSNSFEHCP